MYKKIILCVLLIFSFLISDSQTEEHAPYGPRRVRNKRDELRRRQEVWKTYSAYGDLISEIEYKNDKKEGKCIIYYPEGGVDGGAVREEIQYFDGKRDGPYVKKYLTGQISAEGEYSQNMRINLWTSYYEDGQIKTTGNYVLGKKEGEWKFYNRKGILVRTVNYSLAPPPTVAKKLSNVKTPKAAIKKVPAVKK